jgi:FlaA1/EpsC-like NDP-sugar epimerase
MDVAEAIGPSCEKPVVGIRPGEKIHEEMITSSDSFSTIDLGSYYAILSSDGSVKRRYEAAGLPVRPVDAGFAYNSGVNTDFLSVEQLRDLIRQHVDPSFQPI